MPLLTCSAQSCIYNKGMNCSRGDINVEGENARCVEETCCNSFEERTKYGAENSMGHASAVIDIDCKASSRRLSSLNVARLQKHREEIGADYSLVLTPRFSSGVRGDIADTKTVIITTSTIQAYLSSALQKYGKEFSFKELDEIITRNLGTDFTDKLAEVVLERYGTCVPDTSSFKVDMGA